MLKISSVGVRILMLLTSSVMQLSGCVVEPAHVGTAGRVEAGDDVHAVPQFSIDDHRAIHEYYYRSQQLPPGLAKRDQLPPGVQQQIRRNGQLPPGLKGRPLPDDLERHLSPLPVNYIRLQIGRDIVVMDKRTRITVDVIKNVVFP